MGGYFSAEARYQERKYMDPKYTLRMGVYVVIFLTIVSLLWALLVSDSTMAEMVNHGLVCAGSNDERCEKSYLRQRLLYAFVFIIIGSIVIIGGMWITAMQGRALFNRCVELKCAGMEGVRLKNCRGSCVVSTGSRMEARELASDTQRAIAAEGMQTRAMIRDMRR